MQKGTVAFLEVCSRMLTYVKASPQQSLSVLDVVTVPNSVCTSNTRDWSQFTPHAMCPRDGQEAEWPV